MTQVSSLYLHVPFCQHLCNYCDFYKRKFTHPTEQIEGFHQLLESEWRRHEILMLEQNFSWGPLETLYLGGGTPSLWGTAGAEFLKTKILSHVPLQSNAEFTMEIDPGTWNQELVSAWKDIGLNRISIGTQTLNPEFLKIMDRIHSKDDSLSLLSFCRKNNWNFSLDFLLGLPFSQTKKRSILEELDEFLSYEPKHLSLYILNARSKYPHAQNMPEDGFIRDEYLAVSEYLRSHGFHHYEVSNFALPGYESKHNLKYWNSESVAALGPTGSGLLVQNDERALRYKWKVSEGEAEFEQLGKEELSLEKVYLKLRTSEGWAPQNITPEHTALFEKWTSKNLGFWDGKIMVLNSQGYVILDSLMNELFSCKIEL